MPADKGVRLDDRQRIANFRCRIGYAMNAAALSEVSNGAEWNPDPSFSVAEAILADPAFASVLRAVLSDGHVVVPAAEAKGK